MHSLQFYDVLKTTTFTFVSQSLIYGCPCLVFNALGQADPLIKPHVEYLRLGESLEERQSAYRSLFRAHISDKTLSEIREATNKSWVLGSSYFKDKIASSINRPVRPTAKGGDRKSVYFKDKK